MKISERTIKPLGRVITGDSGISPYRSGIDLVAFFNECGTNHQYGAGFPSRWMFAESCIRELNDSPALKKVILGAVDPRHFASERAFDKISQERHSVPVQDAVAYLNQFLPFDGYEIVRHGHTYNLIDKTSRATVVEASIEHSELSYAFIQEQISKSREKFEKGDYDGAITNARSLVEAILRNSEKHFDSNAPKYDGDVSALYKRVRKQLKLAPDDQQIDDSLKQTLTGLVSIVGGLAALSNRMGDRHAQEFKPSKRHAALVINAAMTFSNFVVDSFECVRSSHPPETR